MIMPVAKRKKLRSPLFRLEVALFALAGIALSCWYAGVVGGEVLRFLAARALARQFAATESGALNGAPSRNGDPGDHGFVRGAATGTACIGRIEIPRIRLSTLIVEGTGSLSLLSGAGHLVGSALPGEPGNVVLAAHRDTFFRELRNVRTDDLVRIVRPGRTLLYRVDSTAVVDPSRVEVLADTPRSRLTLVTCYPFFWIGPAPKRFIVTAHEVGDVGRGEGI